MFIHDADGKCVFSFSMLQRAECAIFPYFSITCHGGLPKRRDPRMSTSDGNSIR
jgi:hypothetical protein